MSETKKEPAAFKPHWPEGLEPNKHYKVACDDKGRKGGSWLRVFVAEDGDVHVSMQEWEEIPEGKPDPFPSVRIRTFNGGGRNLRTKTSVVVARRCNPPRYRDGFQIIGMKGAAG